VCENTHTHTHRDVFVYIGLERHMPYIHIHTYQVFGCVGVCVYGCVYVCMCVCLYVCVYTRTYLWFRVCAHTQNRNTLINEFLCVCVCVYLRMYVCVFVCAHTHTRTHSMTYLCMLRQFEYVWFTCDWGWRLRVHVRVGVWVSKGMRRQARASTQAQVARGTYAHRPLLVCAGTCFCTTTT